MPTAIGQRTIIVGRTSILKPRLRLADCTLITNNTGMLNDECLVVGGTTIAEPCHDIEIVNCDSHGSTTEDGVSVIQNSFNIRFINFNFGYFAATYNGAHGAIFGFDPGAESPVAMNRTNWVTCQECEFDSFIRCPDIYGGVVTFIDCVFRPSARNYLKGARCNFIRCTFETCLKATIEASRGAVSFWDSTTILVRPLLIDQGGEFYMEACTLNGVPATGPQLCRSYTGVTPIDLNFDVSDSLFSTSRVEAA